MPFDDYSRYKDEYDREGHRRIPKYWEEGLHESAYAEEGGDCVAEDNSRIELYSKELEEVEQD